MRRRDFIKFLTATPLGRLVAGVAAASISAALIYLDTAQRDVRKAVRGGSYEVLLPFPRLRGSISLEEALANRRSVREFSDDPITLEELGQLLWATYGISEVRHGFRTAPSAGALYPLEIYAVVGERGVAYGGRFLEAGVYHYDVYRHSLVLRRRGDFREALYRAALEQDWVLAAPLSIVIAAVYQRTARVYGERGRVRYVPMDVGHAGQNLYLQAVALGLGTVAVGAFDDGAVAEALGLPPEETPLYIMPVGRPRVPYRLEEEDLRAFYNARRSS